MTPSRMGVAGRLTRVPGVAGFLLFGALTLPATVLRGSMTDQLYVFGIVSYALALCLLFARLHGLARFALWAIVTATTFGLVAGLVTGTKTWVVYASGQPEPAFNAPQRWARERVLIGGSSNVAVSTFAVPYRPGAELVVRVPLRSIAGSEGSRWYVSDASDVNVSRATGDDDGRVVAEAERLASATPYVSQEFEFEELPLQGVDGRAGHVTVGVWPVGNVDNMPIDACPLVIFAVDGIQQAFVRACGGDDAGVRHEFPAGSSSVSITVVLAPGNAAVIDRPRIAFAGVAPAATDHVLAAPGGATVGVWSRGTGDLLGRTRVAVSQTAEAEVAIADAGGDRPPNLLDVRVRVEPGTTAMVGAPTLRALSGNSWAIRVPSLGRTSALPIHPNLTAHGLTIAWLALLASRMRRDRAVIGSILLLPVLVATGSRSAIVVHAVTTLLVIASSIWSARRVSRRRRFPTQVWVAAGSALLLLLVALPISRFSITEPGTEIGRPAIWMAAIRLIVASPVLGHDDPSLDLDGHGGATLLVTHAHNLVLWSAQRFGLAGGLGAVAVLVMPALALWRRARAPIGAIALITGTTVLNMIDVSLFSTIAMPAFVAGLALAHERGTVR